MTHLSARLARLLARRTILTPVAALALAALFLAPVSGTAAASPTVASGFGNVQAWGYGGSHWTNVSGNSSGPNGSAAYTIHAFFGVQVVLRQVNTSATSYELTANRTMVADVFAQYCRPSCSSPTASANLTAKAWEVAHASANFTTSGTVRGPSGPVTALAIVNSTASTSASLSEVESATVAIAGTARTASASLSVNSSSHATIAFTPALGLVPLNLSATPNWTASSAFAGSGAWAVKFAYGRAPFYGTPTSVMRNASGNVSGTGNVTVVGSTNGDIDLDNGVHASVVRLLVLGPFSVREGFILVPAGADLFGGQGPWEANSVGSATAGTAAVDFNPVRGAPPFLEASATTYSAASTVTTAAPMGGGLTPMVSGSPAADSTGTQTVQAQPETYTNSQNQSSCLLSGSCAKGVAGHGAPAGLLAVVGLTVAVVGLTVLVVGLIAARQPPRREPKLSYASLYPPGAAGGPVPPGSAAAPASPPPPAPPASPATPSDDPLGHLW